MAVRINASGEYLRRTANLPTSTSWTMSGWVKMTHRVSQWQFWGMENALTNATGYQVMGWDAQTNVLAITRNGSDGLEFASSPADETWLYFAITCAGTSAGDWWGYWKYQADESFVSVSGSGVSFTPAVIWLGNDSYDEWLNAAYAHVRVWDAALSSVELLAEAASITPVRTSGLLMDWRLPSAADLSDSSGNGYDLTGSAGLSSEDSPDLGGGSAPGDPTDLTATRLSGNPSGQIDLAWTDNATDEDNYVVQRSLAGSGSWTTLTSSLPADTEAYSDTTVSAEASYDYRVYATNGTGDSGYSNTATETTASAAPTASGVFPLSINGRYLEQYSGGTFPWVGSTGWSVAAQLTEAEVDTWIAGLVADKVSATLFSIIEHKFSDNTPAWANANGDEPFVFFLGDPYITLNRPDTVNDYWSHVDYIVGKLRDNGILALICPCYVGYNHGDEGWATTIAANGDANCRAYGEFLGKRYAQYQNIVWVIGGDGGPVYGGSDITSECQALLDGIVTYDPYHIWTGHARSPNDTIDSWQDVLNAAEYSIEWINWVYVAVIGNIPLQQQDNYNNHSGVNFFGEGRYENEPGGGAVPLIDVRRELWWPWLNGLAGTMHGSHPLWPFDAAPAAAFGDSSTGDYASWQDNLNSAGHNALAHLRTLLDNRPIGSLVPDFSTSVVTGGRGSINDSTWAAAARASGGETVIVYTPTDNDLTIAANQLATGTAHVWWMDPTNGSVTDGGTVDATAQQTLSPPSATNAAGDTDWVLVYDDDAQGYSLPSSGIETLTVGNVAQAQSLGALVLLMDTTLAVADMAQAQTIDGIVLAGGHVLTVADVVQTQALQGITWATGRRRAMLGLGLGLGLRLSA